MTAFKDSQKGGAGPYTSDAMVGRETRTGDRATEPKVNAHPKPKDDKPQNIAKDLGVTEGCSAPIVSNAGGYKPITRGGGRRYEPL